MVPLDEFTNDELLTGFYAEVVDRDDIGVVERRDSAGLPLETAPSVGTRCAAFTKDLDRDIAIEARIVAR